jgi:hypothetical protein
MGGRSYLEPLSDNLPNMPDPEEIIKNGNVVRVNDGNDSNNDRDLVIKSTQCYPLKFYNTSMPRDLGSFDAPVVLTLNPGRFTDNSFHKLSEIPSNLMFVRFRTNTWNLAVANEAITYYTSKDVPVMLTFMAYFETAADAIPDDYKADYVFRKRTLNSYWAITSQAWFWVMSGWKFNKLVYSCGHVEGEKGDTKCKFCGNCLREFFATKTRMAK